MSNGLYSGNNQLPKMTRKEYLKEYAEITEYYEKLRKEESKYMPICVAMAIVNIALLIYLFCVKNILGVIVVGALNGSWKYRRFLRRMGYDSNLKTTVTMLLTLMFPLGGLLNRKKAINEKEQERLKELEDKKALCISLGTYDTGDENAVCDNFPVAVSEEEEYDFFNKPQRQYVDLEAYGEQSIETPRTEVVGEVPIVKEDISHIPNSMFDQNVDSFAEGEAMNRDYLHHIYGESMDFLNKDVRLTRTKYYEMREKIEESFTNSISYERKKMIIITIIYVVLLVIAVFSIAISLSYFEIFMEFNAKKYFENVDGNMLRGTWGAGGFFFGVGWMILTISTGFFCAFVYSTIKNVRQYKKKRERALELLEENKYEQMLLGLYDAGR